MTPAQEAVSTRDVFDRVVVGVDGSPESMAAVAQAACLVVPGGGVWLVAGIDRAGTVSAGWNAAKLAEELERDASDALERAAAAAPPGAVTHVSPRAPIAALLREIAEREAGLVAVGSRGEHRAVGIALGGVTATMLHTAPCSVLVARGAAEGAFPRSLVVGVDGSPESLAALEAARSLARRRGSRLEAIVATGGKHVHVDAALAAAPDAAVVPGKPVHTLVEAAADGDLLVVGSRGLHGLRSLGSVSERVAHEAPCPVLVVRRMEA